MADTDDTELVLLSLPPPLSRSRAQLVQLIAARIHVINRASTQPMENATSSRSSSREELEDKTSAHGKTLKKGAAQAAPVNKRTAPRAPPSKQRIPDSVPTHSSRSSDNDGRITSVSKIQEKASTVDTECCIVQIHGPELGKKYTLLEHEFTIGREEGNHIVVDLDNVSRRHARIIRMQGRMFVQDLGSTNGTYLNDQEVTQQTPLRSGDLIKVGGAIFKFLTGDNVELQYHETIYTLTIQDGLTGINNKRYFLEYLEREMGRCHRYGRPLTLMIFDIDFFKKINDVHGHLAGDYVLRELAQSLKRLMRKEECFARYGGEEFAVVIPDDNADKARIFAEKIRRMIEEKQFVFENQEIPVTVSVGVAGLSPDMVELLQFIKLADANLYKAKRMGRNRVVGTGRLAGSSGPTQPPPQRVPRRPMGGMALVRRNLNQASPGPVLAFEVANERDIIDLLGSSGFESWIFELEQDVESAIGPTDLLGNWRERYVLAALPGDSPESTILAVVDGVRKAWTSRPVPEAASGKLRRSLRTALVPQDATLAMGELCLDRLAVQLLDDAGSGIQKETRAELPFPLAAPRALVLAQRTAFTRFKALMDALESSLRFVVSVELAFLREEGHAPARDQAAALLAPHVGRPLALDAWEELSARLAALLVDSGEPLIKALRGLVGQGSERSALSERIRGVVHERERFIGHGAPLSDDSYREQEEVLNKLLDDLLKLLEPLKHASLVSIAEIESVETDDDGIRYALYHHMGVAEHFPIHRDSLRASLARDWCYLLIQDRAPLCLAPIVAARACESCSRVEVFLADGLWLGPKGVEANLRGVTTHHRTAIRIPYSAQVRQFFETIPSELVQPSAVPQKSSRSSSLTVTVPVAPQPPLAAVTTPGIRVTPPLTVTEPLPAPRSPAAAAVPSSVMPATPHIPFGLRKALLAGRVIPFVGAGVSMAVVDEGRPQERLFPSWKKLLSLAAQRLEAEGHGGDAQAVLGAMNKRVPSYLDAARAAREGLGPIWYDVLRESLDPPRSRAQEKSLALSRALWEFGGKLIITTNYDRVLHWTCPEWNDLRSWDIQVPGGQVKLLQDALDYPTIWHLHGSISNVTDVILTPDGYSLLYPVGDAKALRYEAALTSLQHLLASHTLLFVGFSFEDTIFSAQLRWLEKTFQGAGGPHYVLVREAEFDRMRQQLQGLPLELVTYAEYGEPLVAFVRELAAVRKA